MAISHNNIPLQVKYLTMLSSRFRNWKQSGDNIWNMSCPFCGDSQTHARKARGYVLEKDKGSGFYYYCHKCSISMSLPYLIKRLDVAMYRDYLKELLTDSDVTFKSLPEVTQPRFKPHSTTTGLIKLSKLPFDHPARVYVHNRMIPSKETYRLFYAEKFKAFTNANIPDKFDSTKVGRDEARLVLPFVSQNKVLVGFQGRSLDPNAENRIRYYTIMLDTTEPRIFGLDIAKNNDDIIVFEGPIDSLFIDNAIASAGGDIEMEMEKSYLEKESLIVVYDNEPRNKFTIKKIAKAIDGGYRVCIWPSHIHEKDVNDMIKKMVGSEPNEDLILNKCKLLRTIILKNTFKGLVAHAKLNQWRKC